MKFASAPWAALEVLFGLKVAESTFLYRSYLPSLEVKEMAVTDSFGATVFFAGLPLSF